MSLEMMRTRGHRTAWLAEELCAQLQAARVIPTEESASDRTDQASLRKHMSDTSLSYFKAQRSALVLQFHLGSLCRVIRVIRVKKRLASGSST